MTDYIEYCMLRRCKLELILFIFSSENRPMVFQNPCAVTVWKSVDEKSFAIHSPMPLFDLGSDSRFMMKIRA